MNAFLFPGQGSQRKGMGAELFAKYADHVRQADEILGYSIEELCVSDAGNRLNSTLYTQPAIFVVSVLNYLQALEATQQPDFAAGHSIGEYAALFAAKAFDFATGLRIVQKRAELMSKAEGGGLAAIVGLTLDEVKTRIQASGLSGIEIANINSPGQIVIGSKAEVIQQFAKFSEGQSGRIIPLKVSGAFHTSYMREAQTAFRTFLDGIDFQSPKIPVVSNYTARFHTVDEMAASLANHLANPVRWVECIEHLLQAGAETFTEIGSKILTPMVSDIREQWQKKPAPAPAGDQISASVGTSLFCSKWGFSKPVVVGGSGYGAAGARLARELARHNILSFLDTCRLSLPKIESSLRLLNADTSIAGKYGLSLTYHPDDDDADEALIDLCLAYQVRFIELRGYAEPTPALLRYRAQGGMDATGHPLNHMLLHVAEAGILESFLLPLADFATEKEMGEPEPIHQLPLIDAVCMDTQPWRSMPENPAWQQGVLDKCRAHNNNSSLPHHPLFIGFSGHAATEKPVESALNMGADFALTSSVFLLAQEAELDDAIKTALADTRQHRFKEAADWAYPAFATRSFSHVLDEQMLEQANALQQLYLQSSLNASALLNLSQQYGASANNILPESFISTCQGMNRFEIRAAIRKQMQSSLFPHIFDCDAPFPDLRHWLEKQGASYPVSAGRLADLIYPPSH